MRSIQRDWLDGILNPIYQDCEVGLGERTVGLVIIRRAMCGAGDEEEFIPLVELSVGLVVREARVHDLAHGFVVAD